MKAEEHNPNTIVRRRRRSDPAPPPPRTWSPEKLYGLTKDHRRILFLELVSWAIRRMETFRTKEEADAFFEELKDNRREAWWGGVTWPKATDPDRFAGYAADLAETFAESNSVKDATYDRRAHHPADDK